MKFYHYANAALAVTLGALFVTKPEIMQNYYKKKYEDIRYNVPTSERVYTGVMYGTAALASLITARKLANT